MITWWGLFVILLTTKGLGGSFHSTITHLNLVRYHGPIVGSLIAASMVAFFITVWRKDDAKPVADSPVSRTKWAIFTLLFFALITAGIAKRVRSIVSAKNDIRLSDMVPAIENGLDLILAGENPYLPHPLPNGEIAPSFFLPGLWLVYLPLRALGIDIRYANVLSHLLLYLILFDLFRRRRFGKHFELASALFLIAIALHAFSKHAVANVGSLHTAAFGITFSLSLWLIAVGKLRWLAVTIPFLVLSREIAILMVLPYAVFMLRRDRATFTFITFGTVLIGALLLGIGYWIAGPHLFGAAKFYAGTTKTATTEAMLYHYGACGLLKQGGLLFLQPGLQLAGILTAAALAFLRYRDKDDLQVMALGGLSFLSFIFFVATTWSYLYMEPLALTYVLWTTNFRIDTLRYRT